MRLDAEINAWRRNGAVIALRCLLIGAFLVLGAGCGGGTTGTGGSGSDDFAGKILSISGTPVVNATVTIEETGDSAVTDSKGEFSIQTTTPPAAKATLLVETATAQGSAVVDQLPDVASVVEVALQLNEKANSLAVTSKKITPKKKRPTPKPTKVPTISPTEVPTPIITPEPTAQGSPTPTPTAGGPTSNETPTASPSAVASVTPTPVIAPVIFRGVISSADPALLVGAKIGLMGEAPRVKIQNDGKFYFKAAPSVGAVLVVRSGQLVARAVIDGVTERARKVVIAAQIEVNSQGHLVLNISSIRVIENGGSTSPEMEGSGF